MGQSPQRQSNNMIQQERQRYQSQQGPMANHFGFNYGRGSEADYNNYNDIMGRYRQVFDDAGQEGPGNVRASHAGYTDPFKSYSGYEDFAKTGGYSEDDIRNLRARGTAPVRAMYGNVTREMNRQRSLQGGYAPNFMASMAKMARDQSQAQADAQQNVEAGLAEQIRAGKLQGLGGMSGIETSRLGADVDVSKFNAMADMNTGMYNDQQGRNSINNRLNALGGMSGLYGTAPGMSGTFGNQLLNAVGQGGQMGLGYIGGQNQSGQLPNAWDQWMEGIGDVGDIASGGLYPW